MTIKGLGSNFGESLSLSLLLLWFYCSCLTANLRPLLWEFTKCVVWCAMHQFFGFRFTEPGLSVKPTRFYKTCIAYCPFKPLLSLSECILYTALSSRCIYVLCKNKYRCVYIVNTPRGIRWKIAMCHVWCNIFIIECPSLERKRTVFLSFNKTKGVGLHQFHNVTEQVKKKKRKKGL